MTKKIILFNGAAASGKSVAIHHLLKQGISLEYAECKEKLFELVMAFFRLTPESFYDIYNNRELKETPLPEFKVNLSIEMFNKLKSTLKGKIKASPNINYSIEDNAFSLNLTLREGMIFVSECIVKPTFGEDAFGKWRADKIMSSTNNTLFVDSSCGFLQELNPLISEIGQDNILLIRVHRTGYTFDGDSRVIIPDGVVSNTVDVYNNGEELEYFRGVERHVREFIGS